jgi:hypothetical protein
MLRSCCLPRRFLVNPHLAARPSPGAKLRGGQITTPRSSVWVCGCVGVCTGNTKRLFYGTDYHANLCGDAGASHSAHSNDRATVADSRPSALCSALLASLTFAGCHAVVRVSIRAAFESRKQLLFYNPSGDMNLAQDPTAAFSLSKLKSLCVDGCPSAVIPYDTLVAMMVERPSQNLYWGSLRLMA